MICQRNKSMSANCYQTAYEHATNEIAEINAQIQRLTHRKQLLEKLLEPLKLLVPESVSLAIAATASDGSNTEFPASEAITPASAVVFVNVPEAEPDSLEAPVPVTQPETGETNIHARRNGRSIAHEDIAGLAYRFWSERGQAHGQHEEDWFRAAHELQNSAY
jgi:hypothetical protein